jgi:hypothetical protein
VPERERISTPALGKQLTARGYTVDFAGTQDRRHRVRTGLRLIEHNAAGAPGSGSSSTDAAGALRAVR